MILAWSTAIKTRHGAKNRPSRDTVNSSQPSREFSSFPKVSPTTVPKGSKRQKFGFASTYPACATGQQFASPMRPAQCLLVIRQPKQSPF